VVGCPGLFNPLPAGYIVVAGCHDVNWSS
jgi:hypothetical protein